MREFTTSWIDDRMPYQVLKTGLRSEDFNKIRLGILRLGSPLELNFNEVKGLRCILDDHAWIFVDRYVDDMPLLAWMNFGSRSALTENISCELRLYHFKADLLVEKALEVTSQTIDKQLQLRVPLQEKASVSTL